MRDSGLPNSTYLVYSFLTVDFFGVFLILTGIYLYRGSKISFESLELESRISKSLSLCRFSKFESNRSYFNSLIKIEFSILCTFSILKISGFLGALYLLNLSLDFFIRISSVLIFKSVSSSFLTCLTI